MFKSFFQEIDSFFARDPAAKSRIEILFCYPGLHAILLHRVAHWLWSFDNIITRFLARFIQTLSRFITGIEIHPGAKLGKNLFIDHGMGVVIGETATIGDNVTIYHGVTLGGVTSKNEIRHPQVGDDVIIGSGAQVLGAIKIGKCAKIGSNAVVVNDVKEKSIMVGVPARVITSKPKKKVDVEEFRAYATDMSSEEDPRQIAIDMLTRELSAMKKKISDIESRDKSLAETAGKWIGDDLAGKKTEKFQVEKKKSNSTAKKTKAKSLGNKKSKIKNEAKKSKSAKKASKQKALKK